MSKISNDKYYTPINLANYCINKVYNVIGMSQISEIIEPSVGNGSFLHHPKMYIHFGYDVDPKCDNTDTIIIKGDFLRQDIHYLEGRLIIGNPPFGQRMSLAQKFYNKATEIADYIAFILPISQLNNNNSLYKFDLIYSEDLGEQLYSNVKLHCCFNIYRRPKNGKLNKKPIHKLKDVSIYRQDSKDYDKKDYDLRMCYWGDGSAGKILAPNEHYSAEYKIKINNDKLKYQILQLLKTFDWANYLNCIAMRKIQQFHIIKILKKNINDIR